MARAALKPLLDALRRQRRWFDLDRNRLGERLADEAAAQFFAEMVQEVDPDGTPWDELSEAYREWKVDAAPGAPISVLTGHMRTLDQLRGQRWFGAAEGRMTYGIDDLAKQLATYFIDGGPDQPPRRFYEFSALAVARMERLLDQHFQALL